MSPLILRKVASGGVDGESVIPDDEGTRLVGRTDLKVCALRNVVKEEFQKILGLLLLPADYAASETRVNEESLLAGQRMDANDGMLRRNL